MAILKLMRKEYKNTDAIDRLVNYALNPKKTPSHCYGGHGIGLNDPAASMHLIKRYYGQTTGKQAEHFILAFSADEAGYLYTSLVQELGYNICKFFKDVQVLFSLHECRDLYDDFITDSWHLHFVVNTVNLHSGRKYRLDYSNEFLLKEHIRKLLKEYDVSNDVWMVF